MKRLMIFLVLAIFSAASVRGQDEEQGQYLFDEFQNGRVVYKDGRRFNVQMNYSLLSNRLVFIDTYDNDTIKEIAEVEQVANVIVGTRSFQVTAADEVFEIVQQSDPVILAAYMGRVIRRGPTLAYGTRSQNASSRAVSSLPSAEGLVYRFTNDDKWLVMGVDKRYQVENRGRMRSFSTLRQLLNIYPKQNRAAIEEFIAARSIDFDSVEQVVELCNFAESLD